MSQRTQNWGNKAQSLFDLKAAGFPVPYFQVIPSEVFNEVAARIPASAWNNPSELAKITAEDSSESSSENSTSFQIPSTFDLKKFLAPFGEKPLAVRSSCNREDGAQLSFAGIFESYLGVSSEKEVSEAVSNCWRSVFSPRTLAYCQRAGLHPSELEMSVIVQELIEPDFAGVLFTLNPTTGRDREFVVEACQGRGDKLVSGQVTPSRYVLRFDGGLKNPEDLVVNDDRAGLKVNIKILEELRDTGRAIQAYYGKPQDIEFAVKDGQIYILQSRAITSYQFAKDMGEWTTADFRDGGVSSGVVSPLMWSLYNMIFSGSLPEYFRKLKLISSDDVTSTTWYDVFFARPYWNLKKVKEIQETLPGFVERNFDHDMAIPPTYEGDGKVTPVTVKGVLKALPVLLALHKEYKNQVQRSETLLKEFEAIENKYRRLDLTSLSAAELSALWDDLIDKDYKRVETEYFRTIYNSSNAKMEFSETLAKYKKADASVEYVHLIADLGALGVTLPVLELNELARRIRTNKTDWKPLSAMSSEIGPITLDKIKSLPEALAGDLTKFIDRFYFHSERELDLRVPRWSEDAKFVVKTLVSLLEGDNLHEAKVNQDHKSKTHEDALNRLRAVHQNKGWTRFFTELAGGSFSSTLEKHARVRHFLWLREELRDRSTRIYHFIRRVALEVGERAGIQNQEILYLDHERVGRLAKGLLSVREAELKIQETQFYCQGYRSFKNPNEIGFRFNAIRSGVKAAKAAPNSSVDQNLSGIGCSAGSVRGRARVITQISDASNLKSGEILVVPFTDPGWTPLFGLASGVVTETGGLLSHAALISREYGIPSVLNVSDATVLIPDGAMVEIDGTEGRVTVLKEN